MTSISGTFGISGPAFPGTEVTARALEIGRGSRRPYPRDSPVHELVAARAEQRPDAVALRNGPHALTYAELMARSGRLADHLLQQGIGTGAVVAVLVSRLDLFVVAVLAVLRAGAAYLPLDLANPAERNRFMISDSGAALTLVEGAVAGAVKGVDLQRCEQVLAAGSARELRAAAQVGAMDPAYVMYTSGSTGRPKGVVVPHRAITRLVVNTDYVRLAPTDVVAQAANFSFDAATFEVWGALLHGAALVGTDKDTMLTPFELAAFLAQQRVTVLFLTTAVFHLHARVAPTVFHGLRYLVVGGDKMDPGAAAAVLGSRPPAHLVNGYGPTESTTFALAHDVTTVPDDCPRVPIGRPIASTDAYLLGADLRPVPPGEVGELYLGGDGLALRYVNRPELTERCFVPIPWCPSERMYRTGDLACWRADGTLDFLGRVDDQVKLRGFRVELAEVEAALRALPDVVDAAVVPWGDGEARTLVAYVTSTVAGIGSTARVDLARILPEYMVPTIVIPLDAMPLTPNGKVDRALLAAHRTTGDRHEEERPR